MLQMTAGNPVKWGKLVERDQKHVTGKSRKVYIFMKYRLYLKVIYKSLFLHRYRPNEKNNCKFVVSSIECVIHEKIVRIECLGL